MKEEKLAKFFKRALAITSVLGGALVATATPAMANANTSVICGWQRTNPDGTKTGVFYRNDLTAKSETVTMSDDQWQRSRCDGADGKKGAIDLIADSIMATYKSMNGWSKQRYETTWADRCTNSDPVANFFGNVWQTTGCVNYVKGKVNMAAPGQATPHDLLSCMYNGRTYMISYTWDQVSFTDKENLKVLKIPGNQLNCVGEPAYQ